MSIKKLAGTAAIAAGLGAAGLGLGAGSAQADDGWGPWVPWPDVPGEGPAGIGAPGQLKKECVWGVFGPCGTPPGHWRNGPQGPPPFSPWQR